MIRSPKELVLSYCIHNSNSTRIRNGHKLRTLLSALLPAIFTLVGVRAGADCGWEHALNSTCRQPPQYSVWDSSYGVTVFIYGANGNKCPDSSEMLRENVDTGEVAIVPMREKKHTSEATYYNDNCVPSGNYRYGCSRSFECSDSTLGVLHYYEEFAVEYGDAGVDLAECEQANENDLSQPFTGIVPWIGSEDDVVCVGECSLDDSELLSDSKKVVFFNAGIAFLGLTLIVRRVRRKR